MAKFDLGADLVLERTVAARLEQAYSLSRKVVEGYEGLGYTVTFTEEHPPSALRAEISDREGTRIQADLALEVDDTVSRVRVQLSGSVHVGGVQGMLASAAMVREVARERLSELLERTFLDVQEPEPEPEPEPPSSTDSNSDDPLQRRLQTIKLLQERGLISQDDYERKRRELLELL